jgi:hypothetical protein
VCEDNNETHQTLFAKRGKKGGKVRKYNRRGEFVQSMLYAAVELSQ